jgi:hypothetical protein
MGRGPRDLLVTVKDGYEQRTVIVYLEYVQKMLHIYLILYF